jgi:hypothetical protein
MREPRIVAVMPVSGREELFPLTIKRLYRQEGVQMKVVVMCDTPEEQFIARDAGANIALVITKATLGGKWQTGVEIARQYEPDAVMIVGSGNWFTNGWVKTLYPYLDDYDMVGSESMYVYQIRQNDQVMIHWGGYHTNSRKGDMLGAGRLLSRKILDKVDWQIYNTRLNSGLDRSIDRTLRRHGAKTLTLPQGDEMILKVGSYKWKNINSFRVLWGSPNARKVDKPEEILRDFPEINELINK